MRFSDHVCASVETVLQQQATQALDAQFSRRYFDDGELFGVANLFRLHDHSRCAL